MSCHVHKHVKHTLTLKYIQSLVLHDHHHNALKGNEDQVKIKIRHAENSQVVLQIKLVNFNLPYKV